MGRKVLIIILLFTALLIPVSLSLAQAGDTTISIVQVIAPPNNDTNAPVSIVIAAQDRTSHAPLSGLTASDFVVTEDNNPVTPTVKIGADKIYVAILLDVSTSMKYEVVKGHPESGTKIDAAKQAAHNFINKLTDKDRVALYTFSDNLNRVHDFDTPFNVNSSIDSIQVGGNTCLYDSTVRVVDDLKDKTGTDGTRAILLLTDGVDETDQGGPCSHDRLDSVTSDARGNKVNIFTVALGDRINESDLRNAAEETYGNYSKAGDAAQLSDRFIAIAAQLKQHYTLSYNSSLGPGSHKVSVKLLRGANQPAPVVSDLLMPDIAPTGVGPAITGLNNDCDQKKLQDGVCTAQGIVTLNLDPEPHTRAGKVEVYVNGTKQDPAADNQFAYTVDAGKFLNKGEYTPLQVDIKYYSFQQSNSSTQTIKLIAVPPVPTPASPTEQPTPVPILTSTPVIIPAGTQNRQNWLPIAGGLAGLLLLMVPAVLFVILWVRRRKVQPEGETRVDPPIVNNFGTVTNDPYHDGPHDNTFQPIASLTMLDAHGEPLPQPFLLEKSSFNRGVTIGRPEGVESNKLDVKLEGAAPTISRLHGEIRLRNGVFYITDKSPNGIEVDGRRIPGEQSIELPDNSEIVLAPGMANVRLRFKSLLGNRSPIEFPTYVEERRS